MAETGADAPATQGNNPPQPHSDPSAIPVGSPRWEEEIAGPFKRLDANPGPADLAKLALALVTLVPLRLLVALLLLVTYYILARAWLTLAGHGNTSRWARAAARETTRFFARAMLVVMGYWTVEVSGRENFREDRASAGRGGGPEPRVFVSNHLSYVEVLYFMAELCPSFVLKRTCLRLPLVGDIASQVLQSVPVDNKGGKDGGPGSAAILQRMHAMFGARGNGNGRQDGKDGWGAGSSADTAGGVIATAAAGDAPPRPWRGNPLLVFPEGTTSNGSCLLRFRSGTFLAGQPVYPVVIRLPFRHPGGGGGGGGGGALFSASYESIFTPAHIIRTLAQPRNHLRVAYLPRHDPTAAEAADPAAYAAAVRADMARALGGVRLADAGYREKCTYHAHLRTRYAAHPWGKLLAGLTVVSPDEHWAWEGRRAGREGSGRGGSGSGGAGGPGAGT